MRLSQSEITVLLEAVKQIDRHAQVRLFGSRVDDLARGGDIDILILSQDTERFDRHALRKIRQTFFDAFGEQKIDLVVDTPEFKQPFVKKIAPTSIALQAKINAD